MDEERLGRDVRDDAGARLKLAANQLAAAVLCARGSTEAERALANAVLLNSERTDGRPAGEAESHAAAIARMMDAVLDAANASHNEHLRVTRRTRMAAAISRAGLVLLDTNELASLVNERFELDELRRRQTHSPALPPSVPCAAESAAAGGTLHGDPEHGVVDLLGDRGGLDFIEGDIAGDPFAGRLAVND